MNQSSYPTGLFVDAVGHVYAADKYIHRVMLWYKEAQEGIIIAGGTGCGKAVNQLNCVRDLFIDQDRNLYVVDSGNNRVQ